MLSVFVATALLHSTGQAEVVDSSAAHFHLKLNAESQLSPDEIWKRIAVPAKWWHSDHTYSGDSKNMSIKLQVIAECSPCGANTLHWRPSIANNIGAR